MLGPLLIFYQTIDRKRATNSHTLFPINEKCIDFLFKIWFEIGFRLQQMLMLRFSVFQFTMQYSYRFLNFVYFLYQPYMSEVPASRPFLEFVEKLKNKINSYLHCSRPARCPLASKRVWDTFNGFALSWIAFLIRSIFRSISKISCWVLCKCNCMLFFASHISDERLFSELFVVLQLFQVNDATLLIRVSVLLRSWADLPRSSWDLRQLFYATDLKNYFRSTY